MGACQDLAEPEVANFGNCPSLVQYNIGALDVEHDDLDSKPGKSGGAMETGTGEILQEVASRLQEHDTEMCYTGGACGTFCACKNATPRATSRANFFPRLFQDNARGDLSRSCFRAAAKFPPAWYSVHKQTCDKGTA
jgi:hypothetical protein